MFTTNDRTFASEVWGIRGALLIDGLGGPPIPRTSLIIDGRRISWIGSDDQAPSIPEGRLIDAGGRSVLPGLINAHVHLANDASADLAGQVVADSAPTAALRAAANAWATLETGVTTVRDCGAAGGVVIDLARAVSDGIVPGPRILAAGRVLTMTGGHGHYMGSVTDGVDSARRAVRAELHAGADFIKAMATGGVLTTGRDPSRAALMDDELTWIVREAHAAGSPVASHAIGRAGIANALAAGVDSIEHGFYLDEELFGIAIDQGTFLVPTLRAIHGIAESGGEGGTPASVVDKALQHVAQSRIMFAEAVRSGVRVAAGTDAGTPFNHHTDLWRELVLMEQIGMNRAAVLRSATSEAAALLGVSGFTGTLEVGKFADILVVDGDASEDLSVLRDPLLVSKEGRTYVSRVPECVAS